jgi:hypothetical protein
VAIKSHSSLKRRLTPSLTFSCRTGRIQATQISKYETSGPLLALLRNSLLDTRSCLMENVGIFLHGILFSFFLCEVTSFETKIDFLLAIGGCKLCTLVACVSQATRIWRTSFTQNSEIEDRYFFIEYTDCEQCKINSSNVDMLSNAPT